MFIIMCISIALEIHISIIHFILSTRIHTVFVITTVSISVLATSIVMIISHIIFTFGTQHP